jgi:hypothetical protein
VVGVGRAERGQRRGHDDLEEVTSLYNHREDLVAVLCLLLRVHHASVEADVVGGTGGGPAEADMGSRRDAQHQAEERQGVVAGDASARGGDMASRERGRPSRRVCRGSCGRVFFVWPGLWRALLAASQAEDSLDEATHGVCVAEEVKEERAPPAGVEATWQQLRPCARPFL